MIFHINTSYPYCNLITTHVLQKERGHRLPESAKKEDFDRMNCNNLLCLLHVCNGF